jgi:hypothetical protein
MNKPNLQPVEMNNTAASDPFDPANLRLNQDFAETAGVKKLLTTVPVRKPLNQDYVRVHPDPAFRDTFPILEWKAEKELYIVTAGLVSELAGEFTAQTVHTAINRQGTIFLWPIRTVGPDGRDMNWWRSAREAAELAMNSWVRVKSNTAEGFYEIWPAPAGIKIEEPTWPELTFWELVKIAFKDRLIDRPDHPVIKRLRGEI